MTTILDKFIDGPFERRPIAFLDWFEVHDRGHLEAVLEKLNGVERTGDGGWEWRESVGAKCRVVAELGFEQEFLIVSADKEADLKRCSSRLQAAAGRAVEHRIGEERFEIRYPNGSTEVGSSGIFS